jgi:hypothetical protein
MKCITHGSLLALLALLLIGVPEGFAQNTEVASPNAPARLTVAGATSSRISLKSVPKASCLLHADGVNDADRECIPPADRRTVLLVWLALNGAGTAFLQYDSVQAFSASHSNLNSGCPPRE